MSGKSGSASSFDRLRPRAPVEPSEGPWPVAEPTPAARSTGRRALFSVDEPGVPAFGSVSIDCSKCHQVSVLAFRQALRLAVPSVHLPVVRRRYPSLLHCPACEGWAWTRVSVRI